MRQLFSLFSLVILAFALACAKPSVNAETANIAEASPTPPAVTDGAPRISLEDAKKDFDAGTALFIDTRAPEAFKVEHISGAINITSANLPEKFDQLPKDKKIIAYCS
jgi:hypothetical protein